jgi:hypothetical protein
MEPKLADTEIDWYDFGNNKLSPIEGDKKEGQIAALSCIRNGKYYYKVIELEGRVTEEDLKTLKATLLPEFETDLVRMVANEQPNG